MSLFTMLRRSSTQEQGTGYQSLMTLRRREALVAYLFIAPTFIGFLVFIAGPMAYSLGLSLFEWNIFQPPQFVGLENYQRLAEDTRVLTSLRNSLVFTLLVVTLDVVVALALAVALQHRMPGLLRSFFRTAFILPVVTSVAAISVILRFMLSTNVGVINYYLVQLGLEKVAWLDSTQWALISIALATVWKTFGFSLLLFSAGIQNIPSQFYEAAEIDGAGAWRKFTNITLPQLSPTILFVVVVGIISHLQVFDQARIMTGGGPGDATTTVVMVIWDNLSQVRYGYGSTIAAVFFALIMVLTVVQFWLSRRWVYYEGGGQD
ncbi:MAG TPA: sugar ABC transporter permease [Spirillospora sp.]|nr:sugar ABC transporter permease [Spirillospora sp.]